MTIAMPTWGTVC